MQGKGRLFTALSNFKVRQIIEINENTLILDTTANIISESKYKPFIIQNNKIARILEVISPNEILIDLDPGFEVGYCYTPWSNKWKFRIGDKATYINNGDLVVGPSGDVFQVIAKHLHGVNEAVLGLWQIGENKEPTSSDVVIFTPTSDFHLLPNSDVDKDITNILSNNRLDSLSNTLLDESIREDIWAKPTNYTRDLFIDISSGWFGQLEILEQDNIPVLNNTINYVELNLFGQVVVNNIGWNPPNLKVAIVITENGIIKNIEQVWVKNSTQVFPENEENQYEVWRVNKIPLEEPDGLRDTFTLPNEDVHLPSKIKVSINGLEDYNFVEEEEGTKIRFLGLPLPLTDDIVRLHYAVVAVVKK